MPTNVPGEHAMTLDRARLLRRAAAGAAALGVVGMAGAADALAHDRDDDDHDHHRGESPGRIVDALATAESFGVTFLTEAIRRAPGTPSEPLVEPLQAANTAEFDHVVVLRQLGGRQLTLRFWISEAAFGDGGVGLFESIEIADTIELQGYLTATTAFAPGPAAGPPAGWRRPAASRPSTAPSPASPRRRSAVASRSRSTAASSRGASARRTRFASLEANGIGFGARARPPGRSTSSPAIRWRTGSGWSTTAASRTSPTRCPPRNGRPGSARSRGGSLAAPGPTPAVAPLLTKPCHRSHAAITSMRS